MSNVVDIVVVGGGFAGVWAAAAAAREREMSGAHLSIALVTPGDDLVIRPRLYEPAPERMRVPLARVLDPVSVHQVRGEVVAIDPDGDRITVADSDGRSWEIGYRRLVLASGSRLLRPSFPGAHLPFDVDTIDAAVALDRHLDRLPPGPGRSTAVVIGAGFTGLEVATELVGRLQARVGGSAEARVVLVERDNVVGPELGPSPRPWIQSALDGLGVEVRTERTVVEVTPQGVTLDDDTDIAAATVIWTAGVRASPLTDLVGGERDRLGRLVVDDTLRVPTAERVFAAGDTAAVALDDRNTVMPSCQHAIPLGKHAGRNAAADLLGRPLQPFAAMPYVTCLDLGPAGALFTTGFERTVVLTGNDGKERKRTINRQWIVPPVDDRERILRAADIDAGTRDATDDAGSGPLRIDGDE